MKRLSILLVALWGSFSHGEGVFPKTLQTLNYALAVEVWAEGLEAPMDLAFFDAETGLVAERAGRLRVIANGHLYSKPVEGTPKVLAEGQGGLLAVAFDPNYTDEGNQWIYLAFSHGLDPEPNGKHAGAMTQLVRGRIDGNNWIDEEVIFETPPETYRTPRLHFGTRMVFDTKGDLYFSIGDRGMILRLTPTKEKKEDLPYILGAL